MELTHATMSSQDSGIEKTFCKVAWTAEEDALLVAYVNKHGCGNWNNVENCTGLHRSGKSCRARWMDHLRPGLKKGPFTEEEEKLVTKLHFSMGNQWAKMAREIEGRTDNEIKNFWNTRTKNLKRQGLPIYPPEWQERNNEFSSSNYNLESFEPSNLDIRDIDCEYYQSLLHNISRGNMMRHRPDMYTILPFPNHYREPEPLLLPYMDGYVMNNQSAQFSNYHFPSFSLPPIHDAEILKLPSIKCFNHGYCGTQHSNPPPTLESNNTLIMSSLIDPSPTHFPSSREIQVANNDVDSALLQSYLLGYTEFTPTYKNTANLFHFGSTSSHERPTTFDGDWIKYLLGEDRDNTK